MWGYQCNKKEGTSESTQISENSNDVTKIVSLKTADTLIDMIKTVIGMSCDESTDLSIATIIKSLFRNKIKKANKKEVN